MGTWICYECEAENEIVNPPDEETDDVCQFCGFWKLYSDALSEADSIKSDNNRLRDALRLLVETLDVHEVESLDCDRRGNKYCDCIEKNTNIARQALKGGE